MLETMIEEMKRALRTKNWTRFDELDFELYDFTQELKKRYMQPTEK